MEGKWICFPGDFEIGLAEKVQARRYRRDFVLLPGWRVENIWKTVQFVYNFKLDKPTKFRVVSEGQLYICVYKFTGEDHPEYRPYYFFSGEISLEAGEFRLQCWVYNKDGLPCLKVDGNDVYSDERFLTGYCDHLLQPAATVECGNLTPNTYVLPRREIFPENKTFSDNTTIYDFGHMVMALPSFTTENNAEIKCYFGETLREANSDDDCEQIDFFTAKDGTHEAEFCRAFRYLRVATKAKYSMRVFEEYSDENPVFLYESGDEKMNEIVKTAVRTFALCSREFYLDGAKRDRWVWSGDAYQAFRTEYLYGYNLEKIRRTLIVLFGKSPVKMYINRIMDYTFFAVMALREYYSQTGDIGFLKRVYSIVKEHIDFTLGRTNSDGMLVGIKDVDWVFIDWGKQVFDKTGEICYEQILLYLGLSDFIAISDAIGENADNYKQIAEKLKAKINEKFWDNKRGVYVHNFVDGKQSKDITAYANVFAILYDFADGEKSKRICDALLNDKSIPELTTPYMQQYKLACLFKLGKWKQAADEIKEYWGGMLDGGATTFWEVYNKGDKIEEATEMYGRPFGKSFCHIWGANVLFLIPYCYFGIRNDIDFGNRFVVEPVLPLINDSEICVPLKQGTLSVKCKNGELSVYSTHLDGTLKFNGKSYAVHGGKELNMSVR